MALQFNPEPYLAAFKYGQNRTDQTNQQYGEGMQGLGQGIAQLAGIPEEQRQKRLQQLMIAAKASEQGYDPQSWLDYINGKSSNTSAPAPQNQDQSQSSSPSYANLMPNMAPQGSEGAFAPKPILNSPGFGQFAAAGMGDTPDRMPSPQPSDIPQANPSTGQPGMANQGSPLIEQHKQWMAQQNQRSQPITQQPNSPSPLLRRTIDYNDVINKLNNGDTSVYAGLPPAQQSTVEKIREFQTKEQDRNTMTFIGTNKDGDPVFADKKGNLKTSSLGSPIQPKPQAVTTQGATFSGATPQEQQLAISMVKGDIRPSDLSFRDRGRIVAMANDYANQNKIPFQSYAGNVKEKFAENITSGKMGMNSLSLNTALGHAGDAADAYQKIGNTNQAWLNVPLNKLKTMTNDPNIVALDINLNALNGELATTFKNSSGTDQEIGHWMNVLNDRLTPVQAQAALQKVSALLNSRLDAMKYQQQNVMGSTDMGRQLLSPHGADVMGKIGGQQPGGLMWQGKQLKDTPANRAWLAQQGQQ